MHTYTNKITSNLSNYAEAITYYFFYSADSISPNPMINNSRPF